MSISHKTHRFLVTGTDTGVGKTLVSSALIRGARAKGLKVGAMKPFESGCELGADGQLIPADALALQQAAGSDTPLKLICPYRFAPPVAPGIAALDEGLVVDWEKLRNAFDTLCELHPDGLVVEGAGGLLVPLDASGRSTLDLAKSFDIPLLVVARNSLGTLNHTALTVAAIQAAGLECLGVLLNPSAPADTSTLSNRRALETLLGVHVLAELKQAQPAGSEGVKAGSGEMRLELPDSLISHLFP